MKGIQHVQAFEEISLMKSQYLRVTALVGLLCLGAAHASEDSTAKMSVEELENNAELIHPAGYWKIAASQLQSEDQQDEAVFWYYVGKIRFQLYLLTADNILPEGDAALYGAMDVGLTPVVAEYASSDVEMWLRSIDRAVDWDREKDNQFLTVSPTHDDYNKVMEVINKEIRFIREHGHRIPELQRAQTQKLEEEINRAKYCAQSENPGPECADFEELRKQAEKVIRKFDAKK